MPTALDIIRRKRITDFVWRDVRKIDGTALHVWKNRSKRVLPKKTQMLDDKEIPLIDFPEYYANTVSSIVAYHFVRKEKRRRKQMYEEKQQQNAYHSSDKQEMSNFEPSFEDMLEDQPRRKKKRRIVVKKKLPGNNNYTESYYKSNTIRHTSP